MSTPAGPGCCSSGSRHPRGAGNSQGCFPQHPKVCAAERSTVLFSITGEKQLASAMSDPWSDSHSFRDTRCCIDPTATGCVIKNRFSDFQLATPAATLGDVAGTVTESPQVPIVQAHSSLPFQGTHRDSWTGTEFQSGTKYSESPVDITLTQSTCL